MRRVGLVICSVLLASCSHGGFSPGTGGPNGGAGWAQPFAGSYKLLYDFKVGSDGANPYAELADLNGTLYGTTYGGGTSGGWGTIFKVSAIGAEQVLYRFKAGNDGAHPYAGLIAVNGTLYGTTNQGGRSGSGTIFSVTPAGVEKVLYSFKAGSDGQYPYGRLLDVNGTLYGTANQGGVSLGWGVVFKVSTTGAEHVLYRFKANADGAHPYAGLIAVNGTLYGTTYQGGKDGAGTVFSITPAGAEKVIYSFKGGTDGQYPYSRLLDVKGTLYGTTYQGGVYPGWGVVFKVSTAGSEHVIYRFKANADGAHPYFAGLSTLNGTLYGTTYQGGKDGAGTVFSTSTTGTEHVLYSFKGGSDGQYPYGGLIDLNGTLYGTTEVGGANGAGTVFKLQ